MSLALAIILLPALMAPVALKTREDRTRRGVWLATAIAHFVLSVWLTAVHGALVGDHWLGMDSLSAVFLPLTSMLFLLITVYGIWYVSREPVDQRPDNETGGLLNNAPESVFTCCLLFFLSSMSLAILSRHLGLQWTAIEATTLASAPLIYYHQNRRSLEAAWKYLILCSVGIAVALMGIFFIGLALGPKAGDITLQVLLAKAHSLNHKWLEIAFILLLVGYGTKMGLAPMHNWLPDAHSEAPSPVSALLSAALLNCAFLGILRMQQVCSAAGVGSFGADLLVLFGLISMATAAVFLLGQVDFKRMLAYSSVEHMGILALGTGLGGLGAFAAMLHMINHSLSKALMFMTAGNIHSRYHTKDSGKVVGLLRAMPITGALWLTGWLAIAGSPPFGLFVSEFTILRCAAAQQSWVVMGLFVTFLALAFIGMTNVVLRMTFGSTTVRTRRESWSSVAPAVLLAAMTLILGLVIPGWLNHALHAAAAVICGAAS
jgi:hydrogenase-4 component F